MMALGDSVCFGMKVGVDWIAILQYAGHSALRRNLHPLQYLLGATLGLPPAQAVHHKVHSNGKCNETRLQPILSRCRLAAGDSAPHNRFTKGYIASGIRSFD